MIITLNHIYINSKSISKISIFIYKSKGVIFDGKTYGKSLELLKSFNVPVITTSDDELLNDHNLSNVFSVAPTLKYLSNASLLS